jgi:Astacin (Peptidase family M12A)
MRTRNNVVTALALVAVAFSTTIVDAQTRERFRTLWQGQWVDYVEEGEFAITDGDIIIGPKDAVREWRVAVDRGLQQMEATRKALTIDNVGRLWLPGTGGVIEVPFTIEAGNSTNINGAVAEVNRVLAGVLQWVPRTTQPDYVAFNTTAANSGACASSVGRIGGRQQITGDPECGVSTFVHEMGHAMGLWHVQQDASANSFVDLRLAKMDPSKRGNNQPIFGTRSIGGYDYGSIMHYNRTSFPALPADRVTLETKPPGIDVSGTGTYSSADIDALLRLYGGAPTRTTVNTNPPGLTVIVDGVSVTTPAVFNWPQGSVHRVWASDQLQSKDGFQFGFGRWSHDASEVPSRQLTWLVSPGDGSLGSPATAPSSTVLTANFVRLVNVTSTAEGQAGGNSLVTARSSPWPGTASLYPQFSTFDLKATPANGYQPYFTWGAAFAFDGGAGIIPKLSLLLTGTVAQQTIGALFHNGNAIAVDAKGDGIVDGVSVRITAPGSTASTSIAPRLARTTPGTWRFEMTSPQIVGSSVRHILDSYEGFDNAVTGEVAMPATGVRTVTIRAHRELAPYKQVIPSCAGSINLTDSSAWVRAGSSLGATVGATTGAIFTGWTGTASGTATGVTTTVGSAVPEFVASFNTIAQPLQLASTSIKVLGDDSTATTIALQGSGFTAASRVVIAGVALTPTFVDSNNLRVTVNRSQFFATGRQTVYVTHNLSNSCAVSSNSLAIEILPAGNTVALKLVEYYYAALDYYFLTGRAGDKAALDGAAGWARTGAEIRLYSAPNVDTLPLERHFFAKIARGASRGSHFFTAQPDDQVLLTSLNPTNQPLDARPYLEGVEGYAIPKTASGSCPTGTTPIYRAFKGPPRYIDDGNHRFSTSLTQHLDMVNRLGWIDEGIVFCGA